MNVFRPTLLVARREDPRERVLGRREKTSAFSFVRGPADRGRRSSPWRPPSSTGVVVHSRSAWSADGAATRGFEQDADLHAAGEDDEVTVTSYS